MRAEMPVRSRYLRWLRWLIALWLCAGISAPARGIAEPGVARVTRVLAGTGGAWQRGDAGATGKDGAVDGRRTDDAVGASGKRGAIDGRRTGDAPPAGRMDDAGDTRTALREGDLLSPETVLITGEGTWVQVLFEPACQVWIAPESRVVVRSLDPGSAGSSTLELLLGQVRATIGSLLDLPEQHFSITAESVVAAPRGTDFIVRLEPEGPAVIVLEGLVTLRVEDLWLEPVAAGAQVRLTADGAERARARLAPDVLTRLRRESAPGLEAQLEHLPLPPPAHPEPPLAPGLRHSPDEAADPRFWVPIGPLPASGWQVEIGPP